MEYLKYFKTFLRNIAYKKKYGSCQNVSNKIEKLLLVEDFLNKLVKNNFIRRLMLMETAPSISPSSSQWWPGRWRTQTQRRRSEKHSESSTRYGVACLLKYLLEKAKNVKYSLFITFLYLIWISIFWLWIRSEFIKV